MLPVMYDVDPDSLSSRSSRISERKCEEYSQPITSIVSVLPLVSDEKPIPVKIPKCDYNSVPLIVGGEPAVLGEFPFMALVGFNTTSDPWRCGGTLISNRFVVSAAHCTFSPQIGKASKVRLAELDLTTDEPGTKDYFLEKIILHPGYKHPEKYNDIALLKTRDEIIFNEYIRPACLNLNRNIESGQALALGFGKNAFAGDMSNKLMKVTLNVFTNQRCIETYSRDNRLLPKGIVSTMVCAGDLRGEKDTCHGDSGGPLVITNKANLCQFFLIGLTSFGKLCAEKNTPGIYTRVSEYVDWIEKEVW